MSGFLEVDYFQHCKHGERIAGDVFLLSRDNSGERMVCTLSDGLGSGVKANVLASLTATMGQKFTASRMDIVNSARVIMKTLPVCRERRISYATFTMADIDLSGRTSIIEYDNPSFLLFRDGKPVEISKEIIPLDPRFPGRMESLDYSVFNLQDEDRLILFSDGVSQSGMGTRPYPLGWRSEHIVDFITEEIQENSRISARDLAKRITGRALMNDIRKAKDDITCAVIYRRQPRKLLLVSGPPVNPQNDPVLIDYFRRFIGRKIICGGTTAGIIASGLNEEIETNIRERTHDVPPSSSMKGADLVTEGILTLSKTAELLDRKESWNSMSQNAAKRLINLLMDSDEVHFIVGTRINEAHQDPSIPVELGLRRTIINRIKGILEEKYLKTTRLEYL